MPILARACGCPKLGRACCKYRQWNAAFDAGFASALGKSIITLHDEELTHALKEVDGAANAVCQTPEQVVEILKYVVS